MESEKENLFLPNDKTRVLLKPTGKAGEKAFLEKLLPEELLALKQLKADYPELVQGFPDSFLMKFVWARKLDLHRTVELLKDHLDWRKEWTIEDLDLEALEAYLKSDVCIWTPGLYSRQGYSATFVVPRNLDLDLWTRLGSRGMMHAVYYMTDLASDHDIDIARQGTVMVLDFAGASWSVLVSALKGEQNFDLSRLLDSAQNHMPSRVRDVILLNPPWWVRMLLAIVKPMLKSSLRRKIHACKSSELSNYFTPENVPSDWGGLRKMDRLGWSEMIVHERPTLSEGIYIDPSGRSEETIRTYTGAKAIGTKHGTAPIAKSVSSVGKLEAQ